LSKIKFLGGVFLKGKAVEHAGEQKLPSHVFCTSKGRSRRTVSFERHRFRSFFLMKNVWNGAVLDKTCRFI
jgi:hypothetical protein